VPKRPCINRAKWRLLRGQPAQHLSAHYQLDCDYGTRLIAIYKEGDPVFVCEEHAAAIGQPNDNCIAGVRSITAQSIDSNDVTRGDERAETPEFTAAAKPSTPASSETAGSVAMKVGRETTDPSSRGPARDLTYGNAAKALVDETIWNMAAGDYEAYEAALRQGKTAAEAAQAAGGQLAIVHRKISEYTVKIEAVLSESKAAISMGDAIDKPLERAILEIISNSAISDSEKDSDVDELGALQEQMNRGLHREITPLQAHRIARLIGDRAQWGARSRLSEELKPAYGAVYTSVRNAIRAAVPGAHDLGERLANLYAAKWDLENAPTAKASLTSA
jgi:hypothetical protein